jgi:hypothetical protein
MELNNLIEEVIIRPRFERDKILISKRASFVENNDLNSLYDTFLYKGLLKDFVWEILSQ